MARRRDRPRPAEGDLRALVDAVRAVPAAPVSAADVERLGVYSAVSAAISALPETRAAEEAIGRLEPAERPPWAIALINARVGGIRARTHAAADAALEVAKRDSGV